MTSQHTKYTFCCLNLWNYMAPQYRCAPRGNLCQTVSVLSPVKYQSWVIIEVWKQTNGKRGKHPDLSMVTIKCQDQRHFRDHRRRKPFSAGLNQRSLGKTYRNSSRIETQMQREIIDMPLKANYFRFERNNSVWYSCEKLTNIPMSWDGSSTFHWRSLW